MKDPRGVSRVQLAKAGKDSRKGTVLGETGDDGKVSVRWDGDARLKRHLPADLREVALPLVRLTAKPRTCPFCDGQVVDEVTRDQIMHTHPLCPTWERSSGDEFKALLAKAPGAGGD